MPQQQKTNAQTLAVCQRKILVVDDEASFTRLLKLNLEATGRYAVKVENDPKSALSAALDFRPDLMLIDVMMPGMDGGDVANRFAAQPELREVPMLFLTATVRHSEVEERNGSFGGYQFLAKPVNVHRLLSRLETYFSD
jgi:CheY-like chemotaxis protein